MDAVFYSQTVAETCSTIPTPALCFVSALEAQCTTDQTSDCATQGMQKCLLKQQSSRRHFWLTSYDPGQHKQTGHTHASIPAYSKCAAAQPQT